MRSARLFLVLVVALLIAPLGCTRKNDELKVGVILPLSGDAAVYGKSLRNGIDLAYEQQKQQGLSDTILIYEDDQASATQALSAAQKLISLDKVPVIIGGAMSSTAESVLPLIKEKDVVLISPTATQASLTKSGAPFFRLWPSDNYDGAIMAQVSAKQLGLKRIAVLYVNVAYGQGIAEVFSREFEKLGGTIVAKEGYSQGQTDFRSQILKLKTLNPEALYLPGYVAEIGNILRQTREAGLKCRFLGATGLKDDNLLKIAGDAAEGAVLTYPLYDPSSSDPEISGFVRIYERKFGGTPDAFAAQGYDAMRIIGQLIRQGNRDSKSLREGLWGLRDYKGPGGAVTFEHDGEIAKPLRLLIVHNGVFANFGVSK
jgi:branched-chain amino acid transport system substrate-binding protein